jgi:hypothetical protein
VDIDAIHFKRGAVRHGCAPAACIARRP